MRPSRKASLPVAGSTSGAIVESHRPLTVAGAAQVGFVPKGVAVLLPVYPALQRSEAQAPTGGMLTAARAPSGVSQSERDRAMAAPQRNRLSINSVVHGRVSSPKFFNLFLELPDTHREHKQILKQVFAKLKHER